MIAHMASWLARCSWKQWPSESSSSTGRLPNVVAQTAKVAQRDPRTLNVLSPGKCSSLPDVSMEPIPNNKASSRIGPGAHKTELVHLL